MKAFETTEATDYSTRELVLLEQSSEAADEARVRAAARDSFYRRSLGLGDIVATGIVLAIASTFALPSAARGWIFLTLLLVVPLAKVGGLYERDASLLHKTTLDELPRLTALAMALSLFAFLLRDLVSDAGSNIGVDLLIVTWVMLTAALALSRRLARTIARRLTPPERILVIASEEETERLSERVAQSPVINGMVIGRVPIAYGEFPYGPSRVLGEPKDIQNLIVRHAVDRIVIIPGRRHSDEVADVIRNVRGLPVKISVLPNSIDAIGAATISDDIAGLQLLAIRDARMSGSTLLLKRSMDFAGAAFALLITGPFMIAAAIAIKFDSRGPVFYRQERIGRDGEPFEILKFRTMRDGADAEKHLIEHLSTTPGLFKVKDDPRITRVGGFLRKTSLDELPQLINVLRGDMSLVGPRPLIPEEDSAITGPYRRRSSITPGITGVWQLLGTVRIPLDEMVKLDYLYVANWSLWSDCKILIRTLPHVLGRHGL